MASPGSRRCETSSPASRGTTCRTSRGWMPFCTRPWMATKLRLSKAPIGPRRTLGEYELISELGRGGMGVVYRAWQPSLCREVAVKCLNRPGDEKAEARFRREIKALGQVEHPNVVKV